MGLISAKQSDDEHRHCMSGGSTRGLLRASVKPSLKAVTTSCLLDTGGFEEEPCTALCLVDPILKQARRSDIASVVAKCVCRTHTQDHCLVVFPKFCQHVLSCHKISIIVDDSLHAGDVSNRTKCRSAYLSNTLGNIVRDRKQLL